MLMKRKKKISNIVKTCIIIELIAVLAVAAVCYFLYQSKQSMVRTEVEKYRTQLAEYVRGMEWQSQNFRGLPTYVEILYSWYENVEG